MYLCNVFKVFNKTLNHNFLDKIYTTFFIILIFKIKITRLMIHFL